jgi:fimbrial chaperone protein
MSTRFGVVRALWVIVAFTGLALTPCGASAGSYAVEPSTFRLKPPMRNATMTLTNLSPQAIRLQVSGLAWTENDQGKMRLTPTPDLVVFPQIFTIPPLGRQVVRAVVVAPYHPVEQAFRIVIEELPPLDEVVSSAGGTRISIRTRFTLPVYVEPANPAPSLRIEDIALHGDVLTFAVLNSGNTHLAGDALSVSGRDAAGRSVASIKIGDWHVLAGQRRDYAVVIGTATCLRKLTISTNAGGVPAAQTVDVAACK